MRRLMLALSIASFIATPAVFAHSHHIGGTSHSHSHSRGHGRNSDTQSYSKFKGSETASFDASDRTRSVADAGRSRHHERIPDEEEIAQPEQ